MAQIPDVSNIFNIHRRIGEGTFSTVFMASLKCHEHVPFNKRKLFAVKHLIPTSHPSRVERELKCLLEVGYVHVVLFCVCVNVIVSILVNFISANHQDNMRGPPIDRFS